MGTIKNEVPAKVLNALSELKNQINPEDKNRIALKYRCNVRTIERYLNGEVAKVHFAKDIISDLRRIIIKREKAHAA